MPVKFKKVPSEPLFLPVAPIKAAPVDTPEAIILVPVVVPVALNATPVMVDPEVIVDVADTSPAVLRLPPSMLPETLTVVPV